jgi:spore maturation protein B
VLLDIFQQYGTDSLTGRIASVMASSCETVFYTMSVYFMAAHIRKSRWTLAGALVSTAAGIVVSVIVAKYLF